MNEKLDIFRQRVVEFLTNAGGISRDAMVIGSIGEKQKEENNDAVEEDWDEDQWGNGTAWAIKGGGPVQQEAASTAAKRVRPFLLL